MKKYSPQAAARSLGIPPIAAAIILGTFLVWSLAANARPTASPEYLGAVRDQVTAIPYSVGPLVGLDLEVVPAAAAMLNPNVILQRVYRDPIRGHTVSMVVVHCQDVRDLAGHYPPICYPNAGWVMTGDPTPVSFEYDAGPIEATRYSFVRKGDLNEEAVTVVSFFTMPSGASPFSPNMKDVDLASRSPRAAGLGAAHIMLVMPSSQRDDTNEHLVQDVLRALKPTLKAIVDPARDAATGGQP